MDGLCWTVWSIVLLFSRVAACPEYLTSKNITVGPDASNSLQLQDVLEDINRNSAECTRIYLLPGRYVLSRTIQVRSSVSLQIHPDHSNGSIPLVFVTCNSSTIIGPTTPVNVTEDLAVLSVIGVQYAEISGLVFEQCSLPIQFIEVDDVVIINSTFRNFYPGGAVNVYNCSRADVSESFFFNNTGEGIFADKPYRGNGGGLSFGVHNIFGTDIPRYVVRDCVFNDNSASTEAAARRTTTDIIQERIFNGRGGGVGFVVSHPTALSILVTRCDFRRNRAVNFAGGLYILVNDESMEINCTVTDSTFIRNVADVGGGGIGMGFTSDGTFGRENCIYFFNLTLYNNEANFGGGLYIIPGGNGGHGNLVTMEYCNLTENIAPSYGAAVAMAALQGYLDHSLLRETTYIDNVFERNDGRVGGVLSTYYFTVVFKGMNRFLNNRGTSLRVVSAIVHVHDTLEFSNNMNLFGASVYLSSYGQLLLFNGASLLLQDNKGNIGAAMEVEPLYAEPFLVGIRGNSQCFLIYQNPIELQDNWNVTLSFSGNEADIGSAIYTREVGLCSYVSDRFPHINISESFNTKPFTYSGNVNNAQKPPNATQFNIATPAVNFSVDNVANNASFFPGEEFHVVVSGWDEFGNPTQGVYRIQEDQDESEDEYSLRFRPSSINVLPGEPRVTLQFASDMNEFDRDLHTILFEHERTSRTDSFLRFEVKLAPDLCPPGTVFTSAAASLFKCQCDTSNEDILSCEPNGHDIILRRGLWGVSYPDPDTFRYILKTVTCPPGYCQCTINTSQNDSICHYIYRHTNDNYQCQCFREGMLCGSCVNGTSVSALLDNCVTCGDENSVVIVVLIIADVVVMVTLMIVSLWKPLNPPAWLYPFLFYIQVTPYAARFWPVTFEHFQPYLAYIGSLLGLYLPYDFCLYSTATSLEVYGLRYIPFILALIICPTVLLIARVAKVKVNFSGVWLLIMLLFNQVLHTSVAVLSCVNVYDKTGVQSSVWYYDSSIQCFSGGHAALGVWAVLCILVLMFLMFSPLVPVFIPMKLRSRQLRSVRDAVMYVYRNRYYWCYVVELARRFLIIIVIVSTPATASGTIFLLMVTFMWYAYTKPYKQRPVNYLEIFLLSNFSILLLLYQLSSNLSYVMELEEVQILNYVEGCDNPQYTPTYRAIILALFYYLPIYTLPVVLLVYVFYKLKDKCMMNKCKRHISKDAPTEGVELKDFSLRKNTIIIENAVDLDSTMGSFPDGPPS